MRKHRPKFVRDALRDLERQTRPDQAPHVDIAITPRTEAQQDASRANGGKSCGPKSAEGKAASSKNALKHGWCSTKIENLPPDLREEVQGEVLKFNRVYKPQNGVEERLVETAAICHVRFMRLSQAELMHAQARARAARSEWTTQRKNEVEALLKQLARGDARSAWRALRSTAHGCKALARLCREHATRLTVNGPGTQPAIDVIVRLFGDDRQIPTWSDLDGPRRDFWRAAVALVIAHWPNYLELMRHLDEIKLITMLATNEAPTPQQALDWMVAHLRAKADEFDRRARKLWRMVDRPMRDESADRALFDPSPEAAKLSRYINDAQRGTRNALRDLERMQKEARRVVKEPRARNEPDEPQVRDPETPAPRVAIPLPGPEARPESVPPAQVVSHPATAPDRPPS